MEHRRPQCRELRGSVVRQGGIMRRRTFLQAASTAALAPAAASTSGIPLGFDSYSIRSLNWTAMQLLDYAAALNLDTIQISSLTHYESLDPGHLQKVKDRA